ncbi:MBL fold metallo-hydrolase [Sansalvadorimonas verongulae]|nr:MBL fold metallo-hydrolase [Sansalvadorimonas verongulae]
MVPAMIKQLFYPQTSAFTYLVADPVEYKACLIDPVKGEASCYLSLLEKTGLSLTAVADTHTHADHITATGDLRILTGCDIAGSSDSQAQGITLPLDDGDCLPVGKIGLQFIKTPGHTSDSGCFYVKEFYMKEQPEYLLTGDTLLIGSCGRTDFQNGSARELWHSLHDKLMCLPENLTVYPGHDYNHHSSSSIGKEVHENPKLQLSEEAFIACMEQSGSGQPKHIKETVPANLRCGRDW